MTQHPPSSGPARALVLVAVGLGLAIYLLGFVGEVSVTSSFGGPLLIAGGALAGTALLPRVGRVLAPAMVLSLTGALLMLQLLIGIGPRTVVLLATVLAFLQVAAVAGAFVLDAGALAADAGRSPPYPTTHPGYPPTAAIGTGPPGGPPAAAPRIRAESGPGPPDAWPGSGWPASGGARHRAGPDPRGPDPPRSGEPAEGLIIDPNRP